MPTEIKVPDLGDFKDVEVIDVLVKPGDQIDIDTPLVTLETEKATMDVPSTAAGVITSLSLKKGDRVSKGSLIGQIEAQTESKGGAVAPPAAATKKSGTAEEPVSTHSLSIEQSERNAGVPGNQGGAPEEPVSTPSLSKAESQKTARAERTDSSATKAAAPAAAPAKSAAPVETPAPSAAKAPASLPPIDEAGFARAYASPSVRKFARELGVDLSRIKGSGPKARITPDDVKAFVKQALTSGAPAAAAGAGGALPKVPEIDFSKFGEIEIKPLSRIQKISGPHLQASWLNIPHVWQMDEADITELEETRKKLKGKAEKQGIKLTPLAFVLRACVKALQDFPNVNSSLESSGKNLILKKYINLGFAADTPGGLVVPVIKDADKKDVYEIARDLAVLSEKARAGKLTIAEMQGATFTVSSLGGIGGVGFTPIINAPEVAILGVARSSMKPVYKDGQFVPRLMLPFTLAYDHRVIDGAAGVRFTTFLAEKLADVRGLIEAVP